MRIDARRVALWALVCPMVAGVLVLAVGCGAIEDIACRPGMHLRAGSCEGFDGFRWHREPSRIPLPGGGR